MYYTRNIDNCILLLGTVDERVLVAAILIRKRRQTDLLLKEGVQGLQQLGHWGELAPENQKYFWRHKTQLNFQWKRNRIQNYLETSWWNTLPKNVPLWKLTPNAWVNKGCVSCLWSEDIEFWQRGLMLKMRNHSDWWFSVSCHLHHGSFRRSSSRISLTLNSAIFVFVRSLSLFKLIP